MSPPSSGPVTLIVPVIGLLKDSWGCFGQLKQIRSYRFNIVQHQPTLYLFTYLLYRFRVGE